MAINKKIVNGKVGVIISSDYGAGFSSWNDPDIAEELMFDSGIVDILETTNISDEEKYTKIDMYIKLKYVDAYFLSNSRTLHVEWIEQGKEFFILENDGLEIIRFKDEIPWITA